MEDPDQCSILPVWERNHPSTYLYAYENQQMILSSDEDMYNLPENSECLSSQKEECCGLFPKMIYGDKFGYPAFGWHTLTSPIHILMLNVSWHLTHYICQCMYKPPNQEGPVFSFTLLFFFINIKSANKEIREFLFWIFIQSRVEMYYGPMNDVQWQTELRELQSNGKNNGSQNLWI